MFSSIFTVLLLLGSINNPNIEIPDFSSITQQKHVQETPLNFQEDLQETEGKKDIANLDYGIYDLHLVSVSDANGKQILSNKYMDSIPTEKVHSLMPSKIKSEQLILNKNSLVCFTIKSYRIFIGNERTVVFDLPKYYIIKNKFSKEE